MGQEELAYQALAGQTWPRASASPIDVFGANTTVSLIIPTLNEAENLPGVLDQLPPWLHEIVIVDGGSTDETVAIAKERCPRARVIRQTGRGKGQALREGFQLCTGNLIVALDADGSMDPAEIGRFIGPLLGGCHVVKGSRLLPGGSSLDLTRIRRLGNWILRSTANIVHGTRYSDLCYGYFSFVRGTIDIIGLESDGFEIEAEIAVKACRAGLVVAEVPSRELARASGTSKLRAIPDGWRIMRALLKHRRSVALPSPAITASWTSIPEGFGTHDPAYLSQSTNGNGHGVFPNGNNHSVPSNSDVPLVMTTESERAGGQADIVA